jgi:hypothetical protein
MTAPNLTRKEVDDIISVCSGVSSALKKARNSGTLTGNPLEPLIDEVFLQKRKEILEASLVQQALFISVGLGHKEAIKKLNSIKENIEVPPC